VSDFLLEIGVEEIPDWMIEPALEDLKTRFEKTLETAKLSGQVDWVDATPRRLVLKASGLVERQTDSEELVTGPPKSAGAGAAQGFAKKNSTTIDQLGTVTTDKGEYFSFKKQIVGRATAEILSEAIPGIITSLYFPKAMYWTGKGGVRFIRPIRWIVALLGIDIVSFEVAGIWSSNTTRGHRVLGSKDALTVAIDSYESVLRANYVIVKAAERRARIEAGLGTDVQSDPELLNMLVFLTEWPTPIRGTFDGSFLELPKPILSTVMRHHQRYFAVRKPDGSLAPEFVAVTNTDGDPDGLIRQGNERVLRARFNDAQFFWKVDQQRKLADRVEDLKKVTFQAKLDKPTYWDKTQRVRALGRDLAVKASLKIHIEDVERAALLAKTDLTTEMVKEFTELQGIVGGIYALEQGEPETVAYAIAEHYKPVSMEDSIPPSIAGKFVALADKLDTLRQSFAIGLAPSGSKDPFALRRAAHGVIRIIAESPLHLNLSDYVDGDQTLIDFLNERLLHYLCEVKGFPYDEVKAVLAIPAPSIPDLIKRLRALNKVRKTPNFEPLAASFKRIKNILKQATSSGAAMPNSVDVSLFAAEEEMKLYLGMTHVSKWLTFVSEDDYESQLREISELRPEVDTFFDKILVNDPDEKIRQNRLALLSSLLTEFSRIADFSEIVPKASETT
jgi:glycyl-tRNA synthetase beta chain